MLDVDLSIREVDGQAVVALCGELNLAATPDVESHLIAAVAACGPSVIVDLTGLDGISHDGLPVLLRVLTWTRRNGGDLALAAPRQPVRQVLEAAGLLAVFSVYPSVEQAANRRTSFLSWQRRPLTAGRCCYQGDGLPGAAVRRACRG